MSFTVLTSSVVAAAPPDGLVLPAWASPFKQGDCGPNLEYDNAYLELQQAALGKPESQFEAATPPDWNAVEVGALALLERSRDLRLVALWVESQLNLKGLSNLPEGLNGFAALLEKAWPLVNPPLDEGDPYARLNVVESLGFGGSFFQSLRNCIVMRTPRIGELRLKDFEVLTGNSPGPELPVVRDQVEQFFRSSEGMALGLHGLVESCLQGFARIQSALVLHVETDRLPQLPEVKSLFVHLRACMPAPAMEQNPMSSPPNPSCESNSAIQPLAAGQNMAFNAVQGTQGIQSRAQALAAIDQVCRYLEQAEPTNPAQLLLKRARRLIDKNFMQLMKDLAPEALAEVAKIMGVNPDSLEQEDA